MIALIWWREIVIALLILLCSFVANRWLDARQDLEMQSLKHESAILDLKLKSSDIQKKNEERRRGDLEVYANEIQAINYRYADASDANDKLLDTIQKNNAGVSTLARQTLENYAKVAGNVASICSTKYLEMARYAEQVSAELDIHTQEKAP